MENKLQQAKDTIAKKYGYESFEEIPYTHISSINVRYENYQDIINDVAIEYNRLCNEWISVRERLPEEYEDVLISNINDFWVLYGFIDDSGHWLNTFDESNCNIFPTHWMPLPQPPTK